MRSMKRLVTIVEVPPFERLVSACMTENELDAFKYFIAGEPEAGSLIPGTGGIRKVRWAIGKRGKSGGARIIYYYHSDEIPLFLVSVYTKARKEPLTGAEKSALRRFTKGIVAAYRGESR